MASSSKEGMSKGTKIGIVVTVVLAVSFGIPSLYFTMNPPLDKITEIIDERISIENQQSDESMYSDGEFGNRYTSLEAGFTVEKPNEKWDLISDVNTYREKQGRNVPPSVINAVEFQRPHYAAIVVSVQKPITDADKGLTVSDWFDLGIFMRLVQDDTSFEILEKYISPVEDFGYMKSVETLNGDKTYHYETVRLYNDQFYSFHINLFLSNTPPQEILQEIDFIFNSYKIIF